MEKKLFMEYCREKNVKLVAITKTKTPDEVLEFYGLGQRDFGENKVQELVGKYDELPKDINWHFVGHLQKNKVKYIIPFIHLIHSVDSLALIEMINHQAKSMNRTVHVLLQIKIAVEESKYGLEPEEATDIIEKYISGGLPYVKICGLMGMASFTDDTEQLNIEFGLLHDLFIELKEVYFHRSYYFKELSMGMSGDYKIALEHGATMVRIGSLLFQ